MLLLNLPAIDDGGLTYFQKVIILISYPYIFYIQYNSIGPTGVLIQQHHYQAVPMQTLELQSDATPSTISESSMEIGTNNSNQISRSASQTGFQDR